MAKHNIGDYSIEEGENGLETEAFSIDEVQTEPRKITVNIPSDFNSINEALNKMGHLLPPSTDAQITINVESGHEISEGVVCEFGDWSHFEIVSEDSIVNVASTFPAEDDIFLIRHARGPVVRTPIDANGQGQNGMWLRSFASVQNTSGILNAGYNGIKVENVCIANIYASDWSGASRNGVRVTRSSHATLGGAGGTTVNNCGRYGLRVDRASTTRATELTANGCGWSGIFARESGTIAADRCEVDGAGESAIEATRNGRISAYQASITGSFGDAAVKADGASTIHFQSSTANITGEEYALWSRYASTINAHNSSVSTDNHSDILVRNGGILNASFLETSSSTGGDPHEDDIFDHSFNTLSGKGIAFAEDFESSA